jgi:hypothetical protein
MYFIKHSQVALKLIEMPDGLAPISTIRPLSCVVQACLTKSRTRLPSSPSWFSAVIDTGSGGTLSLGKAQLNSLAGHSIQVFEEDALPDISVHDINGNTSKLPRYQGDLWLKSNIDGIDPLRIPLPQGFIYYPNGGPPVPVIGRQSLKTHNMQLVLDYHRLAFSLLREPETRLAKMLCLKGMINEEQRGKGLRDQASDNLVLERLQILADGYGIARILELECGIKHLGKRMADVASEEGMLSLQDHQTLNDAWKGRSRRIVKCLADLKYLPESIIEEIVAEMEIRKTKKSY